MRISSPKERKHRKISTKAMTKTNTNKMTRVKKRKTNKTRKQIKQTTAIGYGQ